MKYAATVRVITGEESCFSAIQRFDPSVVVEFEDAIYLGDCSSERYTLTSSFRLDNLLDAEPAITTWCEKEKD